MSTLSKIEMVIRSVTMLCGAILEPEAKENSSNTDPVFT